MVSFSRWVGKQSVVLAENGKGNQLSNHEMIQKDLKPELLSKISQSEEAINCMTQLYNILETVSIGRVKNQWDSWRRRDILYLLVE